MIDPDGAEPSWYAWVDGPVRGIIAAVSPEGVIGLDGDIPWHYPADLKRFKRLTLGTTVIMGRLTWESLPRKPLPGRENFVVSQSLSTCEGARVFADVATALQAAGSEPVWFIGGARLYTDAMQIANVLDLTYVPDSIPDPRAVRFPSIDHQRFKGLGRKVHPDDGRLEHQTFVRNREESGLVSDACT